MGGRSLPQLSSQDNPALVSALLRNLTVIELYRSKGKSYWVRYALRRCLAEKKPIIWYCDSMLYLFVEEGVYLAPGKSISTELKTLVWTLVDRDESPTGVPSHLAVDDTKHSLYLVLPLRRADGNRCRRPRTGRSVS